MSDLTLALLQSSFIIGNPMHNAKHLCQQIEEAIENKANLIITAECALSGYLPEDLLFRADHQLQVQQAINYILSKQYKAVIILGCPTLYDGELYNRALIIKDGKIINHYDKQSLPNYRVFDEKRYFTAGNKNISLELDSFTIGVFICEDLWDETIVNNIDSENLDLIISLKRFALLFRKIS